jgi:hypothetical protein
MKRAAAMRPFFVVWILKNGMPGLVPGIHVLLEKLVDARAKPEHDDDCVQSTTRQ